MSGLWLNKECKKKKKWPIDPIKSLLVELFYK